MSRMQYEAVWRCLISEALCLPHTLLHYYMWMSHVIYIVWSSMNVSNFRGSLSATYTFSLLWMSHVTFAYFKPQLRSYESITHTLNLRVHHTHNEAMCLPHSLFHLYMWMRHVTCEHVIRDVVWRSLSATYTASLLYVNESCDPWCRVEVRVVCLWFIWVTWLRIHIDDVADRLILYIPHTKSWLSSPSPCVWLRFVGFLKS